jgi:hypothetical protein
LLLQLENYIKNRYNQKQCGLTSLAARTQVEAREAPEGSGPDHAPFNGPDMTTTHDPDDSADPVHAAIERHCAADAAVEDALDAGKPPKVVSAAKDRAFTAALKLARIVPATLAGVLAVLEYAAERDRGDYLWPVPFHVELIKSLRAAMTQLI